MLDFSRQFAPLRQEILDALARVCDSQHFILGPAGCLLRGRGGQCLHGAFRHRMRQRHRRPLAGARLRRHWRQQIRHAHQCPTRRRHHLSLQLLRHGKLHPARRGATHSSRISTHAPSTYRRRWSQRFSKAPAGKNAKAILPVHLFGQCADWDGFAALQRDHPGLLLIEDAAQAFGAAWTTAGQPARPAGSLGDAAAFSFYPTKNLAAMGDAGLVTTSSEEIDRRARSLRAHGMTRRYYHDEVGANSRLDEMQAAVLNVKLHHLAEWNRQRRERAARYDQLFREAGIAAESTAEGIVLPYTDPRASHVFHQYVIRAPRRDALRAHLTAHQIGSEIYYPVPLHLQAALKHLGYKPGDFPHAERAATEVLALPLYPELREDEQQTVVEAIRAFL